MQKTCLLVRTTLLASSLEGKGYKQSLQAVPGCIARMAEKGPCSASGCDSTQTPKMPRIGPNLQIWTCGLPNDDMTGENRPFLANLYYTSLTTCMG